MSWVLISHLGTVGSSGDVRKGRERGQQVDQPKGERSRAQDGDEGKETTTHPHKGHHTQDPRLSKPPKLQNLVTFPQKEKEKAA